MHLRHRLDNCFLSKVIPESLSTCLKNFKKPQMDLIIALSFSILTGSEVQHWVLEDRKVRTCSYLKSYVNFIGNAISDSRLRSFFKILILTCFASNIKLYTSGL